MVKDKQARASRQEKITLRATPVGSRVMERLSVPNIDKSAELRRLVELGFACEQAGFILDGEVLRQAGRVWDVQPDFSSKTVNLQNRIVSPQTIDSSPPSPSSTGPETPAEEAGVRKAERTIGSAATQAQTASETLEEGSPLRLNLRSLSR